MRRWMLAAMWVALPMPAADPVSEMHLHQVELVEQTLLALVQVMPEEKFTFVPPGAAFAGARTFGEQARHAATMIYMTAALAMGERSPYGPGANDNGPETVRTKAEIMAYLEGALAYARRAARFLTVANHLEPVKTYFGDQPRAEVAAGIAFHSYDHYGQMVIYARMNGVVPPASR